MDWIKNNPIKTGGLVILFIVVLIWANSGSSESSGTYTTSSGASYDPTTVAYGMQLQATQLQQQGQLAALSTQAEVEKDKTAAQVAIATLNAQTAQQYNTLSAETQSKELEYSWRAAESSNTLQAALQASNNATQTQIAAMQSSLQGMIVTSQAETNRLVMAQATRQAEISAATSTALISGQTAVALGAQQAAITQTALTTEASTTQAAIAAAKPPKKKWYECYLTTACCMFKGLPDDCGELTAMRRIRDEFVAFMPDGEAVIRAYYDSAPRIISAIDASEDCRDHWENVFLMITACKAAVDDNDLHEAYSRYAGMVEYLRVRWSV
jgi:hypothetical protein